jgi:RHS repeat-associated protein
MFTEVACCFSGWGWNSLGQLPKNVTPNSVMTTSGRRYCASSMGRFTSPDWSAKAEPVPYAKLDNPQSLNLYAYVGNNPLVRFDKDGHYYCTGNKTQCTE